jgi:hypothetical protein
MGLVITNIDMPDCDGLEEVITLRQENPRSKFWPSLRKQATTMRS